MNATFQGKNVMIIGATGGLGNAAVQALAAQGANLLLAGRDPEKLEKLRQQFSAPIFQVELSAPDQIAALRDFSRSLFPRIDAILNLSGADVRKPLEGHTPQEIQRLLDVNLAGNIYLAQAFLPLLKAQGVGVLVYTGGFGDGRLAFPFYSVDAATRAGLVTFIESVNRELRLEKSPIRLVYFSPSPADTAAERSFHVIWREMGLKIEPVEQVAGELLKAASGQHERYLMGGFITTLFARLNAAFPRLADVLVMNQYGRILRKYFGRGS
jgi:NAD(P)-dependent dehydrogenase (short-subunit alcohol dehydrogenase family)